MIDIPYIDFHCHSYRENSTDVVEIVSTDPTHNGADFFHTVGYHPWWHPQELNLDEISQLKSHILSSEKCLAVGECGLDALKGASLEIQIENFVKQISLANDLQLPVIVHCVRKYDTLLQLYKKHAKTTWVIHGYKRNTTLAKKIIDLGIRLSVAPHPDMQEPFIECLKSLPYEMIHLETDSNRRTGIRERYEIFASLRGDDVESVKSKMYENTKKLFNRF